MLPSSIALLSVRVEPAFVAEVPRAAVSDVVDAPAGISVDEIDRVGPSERFVLAIVIVSVTAQCPPCLSVSHAPSL